ncbi:beta-propeller domain-containing protein [Actinoplanes hulinensis]|uniref:Beta-propeller domain-containing protein n=1 Tax=Actinoplanes hulinensis TaxID=1144547 RepID=A0ABS7BG12_9ACTN|nr:beta-propeller domain-containing protein [Actinoplanes hulinensis]MBW6439762.1 beta-propeller domain-containing protein [Actinoplanes hulinensis]
MCAALVFIAPLASCTAAPSARPAASPSTGAAMRLVAFDSCDQLIADLRRAAKASVGPYGFGGGPELLDDSVRTVEGSASKLDSAPGPAFSGTNVHESEADEPDLVKTDGRRIVTVSQGVLRVVDVATRKETGRVDLGVQHAGQLQLLLTGDSVLVLVPAGYQRSFVVGEKVEIAEGPQLLRVDLSGPPKVVSRYQGEGELVDARMTGATARIVLRTTPRIQFPDLPTISDEKRRIAENRDAIDRAPADVWLPGWQVTDGAVTTTGRVDCGRVSRPTDYSGGSLVSILTFDLARPALGSGDPVAVVADGDTVYATANSLYLASDQRWRFDRFAGRAAKPVRQETDLYKFALEGSQPPVYRAAGTVPGFLINQYALSEWESRLRVATTDSKTDRSAVRVLTEQNGELAQMGIVDGLGKGERIYSVRFLGNRGYVVTFRQTDPLYSLDLSDPGKPAVTGELKITGYSAHLQPVGADRLIGIGQEADGDGRTQGTQVSLFDVSDPTKPRRLARYQVPGAYSEAEYDPHALLWWPAANLLVTPVSSWNGQDSQSVALVLRVTDDIRLADEVSQPAAKGYPSMIQRSLVAGNVLWTLSDSGLQASHLSTMDQLAWLPN